MPSCNSRSLHCSPASGYRNILIEPNSALKTEGRDEVELTIERAVNKHLTLSARSFYRSSRNSVGSVAISEGSSKYFDRLTGQSGAERRQWVNIDRTQSRGIDFDLKHIRGSLQFDGKVRFQNHEFHTDDYLTVNRSASRLAPRRMAVAGVAWDISPQLRVRGHLRWCSAQYRNEENTRRISSVAFGDLEVRYLLTSKTELFAEAQNLGDTQAISERGPDGVEYADWRRTIVAGLRIAW